MNLDSALAIAGGGLANVSRQLAVVSQNVSNADTPGYTRRIGHQTALDGAGGEGLGVRTGAATRSVDALLQDEAWRQAGTVAAAQARADVLAAIDAAHGTPGQGDDLAGLTEALRDVFITLAAQPDSAAQQLATVSAARSLAAGVNRVADAVVAQRQAAQDAARQQVGTLATDLAEIGTLSRRIMALGNDGVGTAALEDQRDAAMRDVAALTGARCFRQPDGDVQVILPSGTVLPTRGVGPQLADAALGPGVAGPGVMLGGQDITAQLTGGSIGANLALRDTELPTFQAELDEFAHDLAGRFDAAGVRLFTDAGAPVAAAAAGPPVQAGYLGLANRLDVNPAMVADATLVRDGTNGLGAGGSDQTVIEAVLGQAFGPMAASSAAAPNVQGLGRDGRLAAPFAAPGSLAEFAATVVSTQCSASADAADRLGAEQAVAKTLDDKVASVSGVSVDTEMSTMIGLQNAYAANARIVTATQQMWTQLLGMVGSA